MRTLPVPIVVAVLSGLALVSCASRPTLPAGVIVGEEMQPREVIALSVVEAHPKDFRNRTLLIEATVTAVCQKMGCWMQVEDGGSRSMVRWESGCGGRYAFPKDLQGRRVLIQGSIYPKEISEPDAHHLEEEAGREIRIDRAGSEINASSILMLAGKD